MGISDALKKHDKQRFLKFDILINSESKTIILIQRI